MRVLTPALALAVVGASLSACNATEAAGANRSRPQEGAEVQDAGDATGSYGPIPDDVRARMTGHSWHEGCPVGLDALALLEVPYVDFDGVPRTGPMVVSADVAEAVVTAFRSMKEGGFRIERVQLVDDYGASDDASMAANNTSAFNCRNITGGTAWSAHSYGTAVDVNPVQNPYVDGTSILPPAGKAFVSRDAAVMGLVTDGSVALDAFEQIGWKWGGRWTAYRDYQHFSATGL